MDQNLEPPRYLRSLGTAYCPISETFLVNFDQRKPLPSAARIYWRQIGRGHDYSMIAGPAVSPDCSLTDMMVIPGAATLIFLHRPGGVPESNDGRLLAEGVGNEPILYKYDLTAISTPARPGEIGLPAGWRFHRIHSAESLTRVYCSVTDVASATRFALLCLDLQARTAVVVEELADMTYE